MIWKDEYETDIRQILNWQHKVTKTIAEKINVELTAREEKSLAESKTVDSDAFKDYLRGISHWEKLTKSELEKALYYFERSRKRDPYYAFAYFGIANYWLAQMQMGFASKNESMPKLEKALNKAIELDIPNFEIHSFQAALKYNHIWDWEGAGYEFEQALDINPNHAGTHAGYSHYLITIGRTEEGLNHGKYALELDPYKSMIQAFHIHALRNARRYDEALIILDKLLSFEPNDAIALPCLWGIYHVKGKYVEAFQTAKKVYAAKNDSIAIKVLENGHKEGGYKNAMQRVAEMMIARQDTAFVTPWQIGTLYTRAGLVEEAINWLEKAYEIRDPNMIYIGVDPLFDVLKDDDEFKHLVNLMNFPG